MGRKILGRMSAMSRSRSNAWKWSVCGLLLLASAINYMDRQTLANAAVRISAQFQLTQEQYGNLELGFGWAFAAGSLLFGVLADRFSVRWVYPVVLLLWSVTGFATSMVHGYGGLLICRTMLGFFESGHWPCAVKATQRLLEPKDRSMGNSVLQSGTSIGAITTPLIMRMLLTDEIGSWRPAFQIIGAVGVLWIILWFALVRQGDLPVETEPPAAGAAHPDPGAPPAPGIWRVIFSRRMLVLICVIALINTGWQIIRAWLPKFLMQGRGYPEAETLYFNSLFYVATDVGCIGAGAMTLWLFRRRWTVHGARSATFLACASLSALTLAVAWLPRGPLLLGMLLLVGAGALGAFPIYHALTQDISPRHQGKITGIASLAAWAFSPAQKYFGRLVDRTGSFDLGLMIAGCLPLIAFWILWQFWGREPSIQEPSGAPSRQKV
jgi:ACS family hexuronate transporter-like MFS transporter